MIQPRILRQRDAPAYCGMDRNRFDHEVRPQLTEIPIGVRGIAFDRHELDAWLDEYIATYGRPGRQPNAADANVRPKVPTRPATRVGRREATIAAHAVSRSAGSKNVVAATAPATNAPPRKRSAFERAMESCNEITLSEPPDRS